MRIWTSTATSNFFVEGLKYLKTANEYVTILSTDYITRHLLDTIPATR